MQYTNAECEERYFSFKEVKTRADYTKKICFSPQKKSDTNNPALILSIPSCPIIPRNAKKR